MMKNCDRQPQTDSDLKPLGRKPPKQNRKSRVVLSCQNSLALFNPHLQAEDQIFLALLNPELSSIHNQLLARRRFDAPRTHERHGTAHAPRLGVLFLGHSGHGVVPQGSVIGSLGRTEFCERSKDATNGAKRMVPWGFGVPNATRFAGGGRKGALKQPGRRQSAGPWISARRAPGAGRHRHVHGAISEALGLA